MFQRIGCRDDVASLATLRYIRRVPCFTASVVRYYRSALSAITSLQHQKVRGEDYKPVKTKTKTKKKPTSGR
jgi:hypothetical protein